MDCKSHEEQASTEDLMLEFILQKDIAVAQDELSDRGAEVCRLYHGLGRDRPLTLDQIGTRINPSPANGCARLRRSLP